MKKILLIVFILFIAIVATFLIWRYIGYSRDKDANKTFLLPRLEFSLTEINSMTKEKAEMTSRILIKNQLPLSFTADSLEYHFFIADKEVMRDTYKKSITLKGNDTSLIALPVTVYNKDLISILNSSKEKNIDSVEYRVKASFYTNLIFRKKITIDIKRLLPLVYIPQAKVEKIKIDSLNFSRAVIQLHTSIENQNIFPLKAKNIAYEFSIDNNKSIKGVLPGITTIKASGITELKIPVKISFKKVSKTFLDLIKMGKNVNYKLRLVFQVESDSDMVKNSKIIIESSGSIKSLLDLRKK